MKISKLIPIENLTGMSEGYAESRFNRRCLGTSTGEALELIGRALQTGGIGTVKSCTYDAVERTECFKTLVNELIDKLDLKHIKVVRVDHSVVLSYHILREVTPVTVWKEVGIYE